MTDRRTAADRSAASADTDPVALRGAARRMLEDAWREPGFCVPNPTTYPWQWCWDSCFHAVIWLSLDEPDRAVSELTSVFAAQGEDGFVPHMTYHDDPDAANALWAQSGRSCITNPPMYGHALRLLHDAGVSLDGDLVARAAAGMRWLLDHRRRADGLLVVCHPWETGCDDTPRWDGFLPRPFHKPTWDARKRDFLLPASRTVGGGLSRNPSFEVASASFNALVAFNLRELAVLDPDGGWAAAADGLVRSLRSRWDGSTWVDGDHVAADAPVLEALLAVLVDPRNEAWAAITDPERFLGSHGLWQVDRTFEEVDPDGYWRGASWAPLDYLAWVAATRQGSTANASILARSLQAGAAASGFAEYWHPESGAPHGARPQTWTALAVATSVAPPR